MQHRTKAREILGGIATILAQSTERPLYLTHSTDENFLVARHIYNRANGEIIATAFYENPAKYIGRDLATALAAGPYFKFTRITCREVCNSDSEKRAGKSLSEILEHSKLIVIPKGEAITKIDGIFCKLRDQSYLAFITLRHPDDASKNTGTIFSDKVAQNFFNYYKTLAESK